MPTITSAMSQADKDAKIEHFNIVIVGHVDHGKSTLLGRLYADTGSLPEGHVEKVQRICELQGKVFEWAFLFDAFLEEQEQGITIDTARTFFKWKNREYILIDAPGHKEFLKNMISGASRAEAAVLLIDAKEGVREQSKRHGYMLSLLGIPQVSVAVNKMDLVDYDEETFRRIEVEYRAFLKEINVEPRAFIPVSAREGDNIANKSDRMPWYTGPTVLDAMGEFKKEIASQNKALRMPVQDVYKFDARRIIAGRINTGRLKIGDKIVFSPSNKSARVASIEGFNVKPLPKNACAGQSVGFTLDEQIFIERGEIAHHEDQMPEVGDTLRVNVFWMGRQPFAKNKKYLLRIATNEVEVQIQEIHRIIDASDLAAAQGTKEQVERNDVAEVTLSTRRPIAFDLYSNFINSGRFVIVDDYDIAGGGIVMANVSSELSAVREKARLRDIRWVRGEISIDHRELVNGHRSGLVLFTGEAGIGKAKVAARLEAELNKRHLHAYLLDGENLKIGLDNNIDVEQEELERRFGEVAHILIRSGQIVVSTSNAFSLADPAFLRPLVNPQPFLEIHLSEKGERTPASADIHLTDISDLDAVVAEITAKMEEMAFIPSGTYSLPELITEGKNLTWHDQAVSRTDRERSNAHRGATLWFTGLSGAGKSTLANAVAARLHKRNVNTYILDGDNVRQGLNRDLTFAPNDRVENIRRVGEVAKLFSDAGTINMVAFISPYRADRQMARRLQPGENEFLEIHVATKIDVCEQRDPKGLYKKARAGEIKGFTGIDAPYEEPENADVTVDTGTHSLEECVDQIVAELERRAIILPE